MELLQGPDLQVLVRDTGPLNWLLATQYIVQTARALAHAHRRDLVHRDIKPGNLILNGADVVKLADLGLAVISGSDTGMDSVFQYETKEGHLAGTLPYMAPEQARSLANATVRSDIYGLGATWYFLLTGKERLRGKTFSKQFENLLVRRRFNALPDECMPQSLRDIYRRMVAYKVDDRYDCCDELADDIEQALETVGESVCVVEGIDVLVVEDSRTDMIFTIEMLRRSNSTPSIHQAKTLADGIDVCRSMSIDLVLLDLSLPDSIGVETVSRFREAVQSVPLVILTGMTKDEVGADCLAAGADSFISKNGLTPHRMERTIFVTLSRCGVTRKAGS
jgi:serine/threonine protein kinase